MRLFREVECAAWRSRHICSQVSSERLGGLQRPSKHGSFSRDDETERISRSLGGCSRTSAEEGARPTRSNAPGEHALTDRAQKVHEPVPQTDHELLMIFSLAFFTNCFGVSFLHRPRNFENETSVGKSSRRDWEFGSLPAQNSALPRFR